MSGRRTGAVVASVVAAAALLAGCTSSPVAPPTPIASRSVAPSSGSSGVASQPAPSPTPTDATPVTLKCAVLVPTSVLRSFGSEFDTAKADPEEGSDVARVAALQGRTCRWIDRDSNAVVEVSVAKPSKHDLLLLKNDLVERSNSVPTYGEEAYFRLVKKVGQVDAFHGRYWIAAASPLFFEPGDASGIIQAVGDALDGKPRSSTPSPTTTAPGSVAPTAPSSSATP